MDIRKNLELKEYPQNRKQRQYTKAIGEMADKMGLQPQETWYALCTMVIRINQLGVIHNEGKTTK